jgi:RNA polymerase sigma-70 factor (ECF subfamily)
MERDLAQQLVTQAFAGHDPALEALIRRLTPVIQARVARALLAGSPEGGGPRLRQQIEDLAQEVFVTLFADGGRILRSWRPERGLSLENFVGLVARRRVASLLRSGKTNPWKEDPTLDGELDGEAPQASPETRAATRQQLRLLLGRLREELSPLGWHLFELLLVREVPVARVETETGMSRDALYAWRSRLKRLARKILEEIVSESPGTPRISEGRHV